ncbi:MAG: hypothetical protein WC622_11235 [Pedobacter sp.]|jgi:hypothetical protein|uniref:hypothetical protein n=1 Tax=Pedobacter sp. TaxID=1411316 RepID=UPI0035680395
MKIPKLILSYSKLTDAQLNLKAQTISDALTGNTNFPTTTPTLADFNLSVGVYNIALNKAATGDRQQIALKNQARLSLISAMRQMALDISSQANGDKAQLISSGFDIAKEGEGIGSIENPIDFTMTDGANSGEMVFSCKGVKGAISYNFQYTDETPTDATQWKIQPSSSRQFTFKGLKSGTRLYGRITAVGRKEQMADSDIISRVVQ